MNISRPFIERPVMTTLLMAALVVFGLFAYLGLPVSELPNVDFPTIEVSAAMPGASPSTMANSVARPLESAFSGIDGIKSMNSTSSTGSTRITLQFDLSRNVNNAAQDVQSAISETMRRLPSQMTTMPTMRKMNPAQFPIIYIALDSATLPMTRLDRYAQTRVADRLSTIPGVAQVIVFGAQKYAVRVNLDPYSLKSHHVTLRDVATAIQKGNANLPSGTLQAKRRSYTVHVDGQLHSAAGYNNLVVAWRGGAPVRLSDLGTAVDGVQQTRQVTRYNGRQSIVLAIKRQPGANTVAVAQAIRKALPGLQSQAPGDAAFHVIFDQSDFIRASVREVELTLGLSVVLVVLVILLFLRNFSATLISAFSLPVSLIGTFAMMKLLGFSLDTLSLMALTLSVGFVVDDAIVMQENIVRYLEKGLSSTKAALVGSKEIGFTVISMTASLIAVFIPILFAGGIIGKIFTEFAATLAAAVAISAIVALTLTPMLAGRWLRPQRSAAGGWGALEHIFDAALALYMKCVRASTRFWPITLLVALGILCGSVYLFRIVPKGFVPPQDSGLLMAMTRAPEGISFSQLEARQNRIARIVRANPDVAAVMSSAGQSFGGNSGGNVGRLIIRLVPRGQRNLSSIGVMAELRKDVASVHGIRAFFMNPSALHVGAHSSNASYQFMLTGPGYSALAKAAPAFEKRMKGVKGVVDVNDDLQDTNPRVDIRINRDRASSLGITATQIEQTLYDAYGQGKVSTIYAASDSYEVIMQIAPKYQNAIAAMGDITLKGASGKLVPLSVIANISRGVGPLSITHSGQMPSVTISFNLTQGTSLGDVTGPIQRIARTALPTGISGEFAGNAKSFGSSMTSMPLLLLATVLVIYMVLGILYENFIHPITILTALPLAAFGAIATLILFHSQLDIYSFAGIILLVGLVKKNGIIMIDFAIEARRKEGLDARDAILEACRIRFRPIMMTTTAAILGTLPLALGIGAGAASRRPLGLAVVGGLVFSQLLTLLITPAFYVAMEKLPGMRRRNSATNSGQQDKTA